MCCSKLLNGVFRALRVRVLRAQAHAFLRALVGEFQNLHPAAEIVAVLPNPAGYRFGRVADFGMGQSSGEYRIDGLGFREYGCMPVLGVAMPMHSDVAPISQGVEKVVVSAPDFDLMGQGDDMLGQIDVFEEIVEIVAGRERQQAPSRIQWILGERMGECAVSIQSFGHGVLYRLEIFLRLASAALVVGDGGFEVVEVVAVRIFGVDGDDGWRRQIPFVEPEGRSLVVDVETEIGAVDGVEAAVGELGDFFAFPVSCALPEVVGGDH